MNAVRSDDDVAFGGSTVFECDARHFAMPLEAGAAVSSAHNVGRQGLGEHVDEVGPMHAIGCVPAR